MLRRMIDGESEPLTSTLTTVGVASSEPGDAAAGLAGPAGLGSAIGAGGLGAATGAGAGGAGAGASAGGAGTAAGSGAGGCTSVSIGEPAAVCAPCGSA